MLFDVAGKRQTVDFEPRLVVIAGFTGANRAAVDDHIRELANEGVAPPPDVPAFYVVPSGLLCGASVIEVPTPETSGEVEPVLLCTREGWFVAAGSDHTARDLERIDIGESKRACPKVLSSKVWPYEEASRNWNCIVLRSWVRHEGEKILYQEAPLAELMPVPEILRKLEQETGEDVVEAAVFLGTVPLLTSGFIFSDRYWGELFDPVAEKRLGYEYGVQHERGSFGWQ